MKFDDASWHFGTSVVPDEDIGPVHMGVFLKLMFAAGFASAEHLEAWPSEVKAVVAGTLEGTAFLMKFCDGKLIDEDFNEEGNSFASWYYQSDWFGDASESINFGAQENDQDFEKISSVFAERLSEFRNNS